MKNAILLAFAFPCLIGIPLFATNSEAAATSLVPLENNDTWVSKPTVAAANTEANNAQAVISGDNVFSVWESGFTSSSDGGNTFSSPVNLAIPYSGVYQIPQIAIFQNNVYIVYTSGKDVFMLRSTDSGKTFSSPINVSKMGVEKDPYAVVYDPIISIADGGKRVYVGWIVWQQMYFSQSSDGGLTFGDHTNVSKEGETVLSAKIVSANSNVYLVWSASDDNNINHISFARSNDQGHTFQSIPNISANKPPYSSSEPQLAIGSSDGNVVYLVWRDEVPLNQATSNLGAGIAFAKSIDSGKTFDITRYIGSGAWPTMSVSGQNIYIAFGISGNATITFNVGFVKSLDAGKTFSKQVMISNQTWPVSPYDDPPFPSIAADGANVFVAWRYTGSANKEDVSNHETFLATSYDEGRTFTRQLNISASIDRDTRGQPAVLAAPVDKVFVFWPEETILGNSSRIDLMLVKGQIPEEYTQPYRQVSYMTPVEPYNPAITIAAIAALAVGIGAGGTFLFIRRRRKVK